MRIAFLGLGRMGQAIAGRVLASDEHQLSVWNRSPGKADDLVKQGATEAASISDAVAEAELVCLMLAGPDALAEVLTAVLDAVPRGAVVLDLSTVGPQASRDAAERCDKVGVRFVDAPVAGSVTPAERGELGVFLGGAREDVSAVHPVVALWGASDRIVHVGPVGAGSSLKLAVNLTLGVAISGVGEALRLAHDLGVDKEVALDALEAGPLGWTLAQKRGFIEAGDFDDVGFSLDLVAKDLDLCLTSARHGLPVVLAAHGEMTEAIEAGHGEEDYSVLASHLAGEGHPNSQ